MNDKIREAFEAANPIPEGVVRYQDGYILHTIGTLSPAFSFIKAGEFIAKFAGYKEGQQAAMLAVVDALVEHIRSLTERLESAEKDAGRIDFLVRKEAVVLEGRLGFWLHFQREDSHQSGEHESARSAIDAAIAQQPAPVAVPDALPYWEPCNPACDTELNGFRSKLCDCAQAKAALTAPPAAEQLHPLEQFTDACSRLHSACNKVRAKLDEMNAAEQPEAVKVPRLLLQEALEVAEDVGHDGLRIELRALLGKDGEA